MKSNNYRRGFLLFMILMALVFALSSCGSGGGSGTATTGTGTGSVAVLLTDSPSTDFDEINMTITQILLLSEDSKVTVFSGRRTFNLLDLRNERSLLINNNVPSGWYDKIRLIVEHMELVKYENGNRMTFDVSLPGNKKVDLNPRREFYVAAGETLTLQLDLDADKCIHIVEKGSGKEYKFRPVVFIDILDGMPPEISRFVRVQGVVVSTEAEQFRLCGINRFSGTDENGSSEYSHDDPNEDCINVHVSDKTTFFSADANGRPVRYADLYPRDMVSVIGLYHTRYSTDDDGGSDEISSVDAIVVEIGTFMNLEGIIRSGVDDNGFFDFEIGAGQGFAGGTLIKVKVQDDGSGNEFTKIYSSEGKPLDAAAIADLVGESAEIDGILIDDNPDILNAAFIIVDTPTVPSEKLSGKLYNISCGTAPATFDLLLSDGTSQCVDINEGAAIFLIDDGSRHSIDCDDLIRGQEADVHGSFDTDGTGCFGADLVVVEASS